jgi:chromosome segregation ATPase
LSIGGGKAISSSNEAGHAVVSVISIRGFTDAYAIYCGWAGVYHGVRLDQGGTVQVGGGNSGGGKHSVAAAQVQEEEDMTPEQEKKLNRTVEGVDQALRALTQVNNRVYSIEQKVNHSFEADDQSLTSIGNVGGRIYQIEQKVNHLVEAVDHMLQALTQVNERAYGAYAQSKAALDSLAEVAKALGERK